MTNPDVDAAVTLRMKEFESKSAALSKLRKGPLTLMEDEPQFFSSEGSGKSGAFSPIVKQK
ncbi:hypothetical protein [Neptuniibacter sp. QD37_11]|uniref:hypothetical protein n=1 Tax=Neptuniibacter sp. QD37_11 TaxID=3398209 RepID=UPI0039F492EF